MKKSPRDEIALHIVHAALGTALRSSAPTTIRRGLGAARKSSVSPTTRSRTVSRTPQNARLNEIIPNFETTGRARFTYGLAHAAKGLELQLAVKGTMLLSDLVAGVARQLPMRLYQCQDPEGHIYKQRGTGICRIDGTQLVEISV